MRQPVNLGEHGSVLGKQAGKAALSLLGVSVCLLALASPALAAKPAKPKQATSTATVLATLTIRTPNVAVKAKGKPSYKAGKNGQTLRQGDALRTDVAGLAEISYTDGSYTRLGPSTEFSISKLTNKQGARQTQGSLTVGSAFNRAAKVSETGAFEIKAGGATAAVEGTVFVVICTQLGTQVSCQFIDIKDPITVQLGNAPPVQLDSATNVTLDQGQFSELKQLTYEDLTGNLFIAGNLFLDDLLELGGFSELPPPSEPPPNPEPQTVPVPPPPPPPPPEPVVQADDIEISQYPPDGELTVDDPNIEVGGQESFRGSGCKPSETVAVLFDGVQVGTLPTDSTGSFAGTITIPRGTTPGQHLLTVRGASCELNAVINVLGAAALAFTGASSHTSTYVLAGAAAVVIGSAFVLGSRRRHSGSMRRGARRPSA
ncbi:MAG: FecR family protein [Acidimicrobiia bacterium]